MNESDRDSIGRGRGDATAQLDDAALVGLALTRPQAFELLYLRYRHPVLAFCYRQLGDRDEAKMWRAPHS